MKLLEYIDTRGRSAFGAWFRGLDAAAAAKVSTALTRIGLGNLSNAKSVGQGVLEFRIDFGPGYRVYFGREGHEVIILLAGGSKKRQRADIAEAKARWADYKVRRST